MFSDIVAVSVSASFEIVGQRIYVLRFRGCRKVAEAFAFTCQSDSIVRWARRTVCQADVVLKRRWDRCMWLVEIQLLTMHTAVTVLHNSHILLHRERDHAIFGYQKPPWANLAFVSTAIPC